jgi:cation diffusion facilitator CzcD-associated flavoprotein CzcO/thiol-disulfide isomerase/thioredoxin
VVILGAGMSGLCMAIGLQRAGMHNFVIVEKQPGLGGTWWDNTYPGAHVDVPSPVYSFSFAPNPDWSRRFASAPEIQVYMQRLAERHGLLAHMRLGTRLTEATFNEASGHWTLRTDRGDTLRAPFFVCSTGPLNQPRWPDIPGLDRFKGPRLHSARWDATVPLAGRRVAVIGTGSTASQLIPPIAAQAGQLFVFQRTANWVLPRLDRVYNRLDHLLAHFPPYARTVRWCWTQILEWGRRGFDEGTLARKGMLKTAAAHRRRQLSDPALREKLTPAYPLGCKRLIYSSDFYPAMSQPNVELVTDGIARITEGGIVTADGQERAIDVLVCATGFETVQLLSSITVTGLGGRTLRETWANGPEAFHGISVAGFPQHVPEPGAQHRHRPHLDAALHRARNAAFDRLHAGGVEKCGKRWIEVRPEVMRAHNDALQRAWPARSGACAAAGTARKGPHRGAVPRFHRRIRQGRAASEPERLPHGLRGRPANPRPTPLPAMLSLSLGPIALPVGPVLMLVASVLASMVAEWVARNAAKQAAVDGPDGTPFATTPNPRRPSARTPPCRRGRRHHRVRVAGPAGRATGAPDVELAGLRRQPGIGDRHPRWRLEPADRPRAVGLAWLLRLGWRTPTQRPALAAGAVVGLVIWGMGLLMQQRAAPAGYPEVSLVALKDGQPATLAQAARGRPAVVNLWASWCGPCRVEMPDLADAQRRHTDMAFLFVNQGESAEKVQAFMARSGLALDEVWLDQGSSLGRAIRSPGLPTTVFLDAQGRQVDAHFGVLSAASLQAKVEALRRRSAGR